MTATSELGTSDLRTIARRALVCLDLTNLDDACDADAIDVLCGRAQTRHGSVAAVCVWPRFVAQARAKLAHTGVHVATVVNFPTGEEPIEAVVTATKAALADGADEIDMVVPWKRFMAGDEAAVTEAVRAVKAACGAAPLKAILETGEIGDEALIGVAAMRALDGGADFLKTSTGKVPVNATPRAAEILLDAIARSDAPAGFKAAGGVRTVAEAGVYLALADRIMGPGWAGPKHFRIGASSLLDALLAALEGEDVDEEEDGY
ncbi:MAG: deoxyribose-phosphate aldolase [Amaricoccus sp.]|uniref:deoxyribose-phosphate aldolase n=1 Tax=Amaricoccus sp. TaxID=1872485 RepID=UPI003314F83C